MLATQPVAAAAIRIFTDGTPNFVGGNDSRFAARIAGTWYNSLQSGPIGGDSFVITFPQDLVFPMPIRIVNYPQRVDFLEGPLDWPQYLVAPAP